MDNQKPLSEQESLRLITTMIQKAKGSYHETGIGSLLWGAVVSIASFVTYLRIEKGIYIGFDIWLIVLIAIIPQILISVQEKRKVKLYEDDVIDIVWLIYGVTIFGFSFYQQVVPEVTNSLIQQEGWTMIQHFSSGNKPDKVITPFTPSFYSIYILIYAFPTIVTGIVKKCTPMIMGAIITYVLFIVSCFTRSGIDMLLGTFAALACWFIPGIILRRKYLAQKSANV
ncbi:MAG: hypothetical protein RL596_1511 [Bacteroidota bacterium]|jgi:hypothetical protein